MPIQKFGAPHGCLVGEYKALGEKNSALAWKKKTQTLPRKIWKYNEKYIFYFFCCWSKLSKKNYNRIGAFWPTTKLLSKSILDFGKWENWKYANTYLHIFSLTTSRSPNLISKAVLKWEGPYFSCKKKIGAFWPTTKKLKIGFPIVFSNIAQKGLGFFSSRQSTIFFTKRLVFTY